MHKNGIYEDEQKVLHERFSIRKHKQVFVNYLEVIMHSDGKIEYAVPSHAEKLIEILSSKTGETKQEIYDRCPKEMWFDFVTWICLETKCIAVWNDHFEGSPNKKQSQMLRRLAANGLYKGQYVDDEKYWYGVRSVVLSDQSVSSYILGPIRSTKMPASTHDRNGEIEIFTDWFDSLEEAKQFLSDTNDVG